MSNPIVSFDEQAVKDELRELVRKTIEETINAMLDEEADRLVGAGPYERTDERAVSSVVPLPSTRLASDTKGARRRSRRPSSRCTWPARRRGASRTSARSCGGAGVSAGTVSNLNDKAFKGRG